eukprot:6704258-Prymnesium_polylepis.1
MGHRPSCVPVVLRYTIFVYVRFPQRIHTSTIRVKQGKYAMADASGRSDEPIDLTQSPAREQSSEDGGYDSEQEPGGGKNELIDLTSAPPSPKRNGQDRKEEECEQGAEPAQKKRRRNHQPHHETRCIFPQKCFCAGCITRQLPTSRRQQAAGSSAAISAVPAEAGRKRKQAAASSSSPSMVAATTELATEVSSQKPAELCAVCSKQPASTYHPFFGSTAQVCRDCAVAVEAPLFKQVQELDNAASGEPLCTYASRSRAAGWRMIGTGSASAHCSSLGCCGSALAFCRWCGAEKGKESEPKCTDDFMGRRMEVYWAGDRKWYGGEVISQEGSIVLIHYEA